jgi:transcriptional regulator with GAF, ATPase, and Fis domain
VVALALSATGKRRAALDCVVAGEALANDAEPRARLAGARGYVLAADDPEAAFAAYRAAADYATRAGAVLEEASYLTSAAALAVDEGFLDEAAQTAERAALLWDALGRPGHAARAWLARAAAFATARLPDETLLAAERAEAAADLAGDDLAAAYAALAIADVAEPASELGRAAAARARARVEGASAGDRLRVAARRLRHGDVAETELERLDRAASDPEVAAGPRLEWWGARAVTTDRFRSRGEAVVRALVALASARAPIASRGPALAAGAELAARAGLGDPVSRLSSELRRVADALVSRAGRPFDDAVRHLDWVARAQDPAIDRAEGPLEREQAARLEQLVRSLGSTEDVGDLLRQVLDALVAWTGVERGLLLLRDEGGSLVPRAARNLAQRDLVGEQLALSQSLATSALESLEPVVAVDAAGELPTVHRSVHTLRLRSVLAVPLLVRGDALGVVYLDDRVRRGAFGQRELAWVKTLASLAAAMIATALRAERSAEDARTALGDKGHLERALAERDAHVLVLEQELGRTQGKPRGVRPAFDAIVAESEPMLKTLAIVDRTAAAGIPVLLMGESGSGKELFARAIHEASPRSKKPFVSENCSAIPETLLESALFGHVKGAFTGADRPRVGLFEAADGGTLFLDEVGEMSLAMQAKLLRVLEDGVVRPLGTERSRKVDVRLVAATLRNLEAMVAAKTFREDLYYRISTLTVRIPPLRERASDIPLLVRHFLDKHAGTAAPRGRSEITKAALRRLVDHAWPGNVRQLENEIRRAIVMSEGIIDVGHLSPELADPTKPAAADLGLDVKKRVDLLESDLVREALRRTHGNQTKAAKLLGLSRFGLQKMIKRLAIKA